MFDKLPNKILVLDICGNYSRVSRFALENNMDRVIQFLNEANIVLQELNKRTLSKIGKETLTAWKGYFERVHNPKKLDKNYIDDVITLDTVLTGRASLF